MTITERIKSELRPNIKLPNGFVHDSVFDTVLLMDSLRHMPELVLARNGHSYVYFSDLDTQSFELVRAMGFAPRMHKSRKYIPAKLVYRARIWHGMSVSAKQIVHNLQSMDTYDLQTCLADSRYIKYIENYKSKTK